MHQHCVTSSRRRVPIRRFEQLESRRLLAAELLSLSTNAFDSKESLVPEVGPLSLSEKSDSKVDVIPSLTYHVGGENVGLDVLPNKVAIRLQSDSQSSLPENYRLERVLNGSFAVYEVLGEEPFAWRYQLSAVESIEYSAPVFVSDSDGSELVVNDTIIVSLASTVDADDFFSSAAGVTDFRRLRGSVDQYVVTVSGRGETALRVSNQLLESSGVQWSSPDFYMDLQKFYTPNDPRFTNQWHLENTGQGGGLVDADPDLTAAWDINQGGSSDIVIGVIDDAVDTHPDLLLYTNPGEIWNDLIDNDGNGWVDDVNGWNFVSDNNVTVPTFSSDNHGTAVAGVAAAIGDNNVGVVGASYNSPVLTARIFEGNSVATTAAIAESLRYMAGFTADGLGTWRSADVVNNSWGGGPNSDAINSALLDGTTLGRQGQGTTYLFATGNNGGSFLSQPAAQAANIPGVIAVGAMNNFGNRSGYSQYGVGLDFVAPSNGGSLAIDTTDRVGGAGYSGTEDYTGTGSTGFGGTSSATPLATGIAALALAELEANGILLSPAELREYLRANTQLVGGDEYSTETGTAFEFGYGGLNAGMALANIGNAEISVLTSQADLVSGQDAIDMGSAIVGSASTSVVLRVRNQGTEDLVLSNLSVSGEAFSIQTPLGSTTLGIGEFTTFELAFEPTASGLATGSVTLTSTDTDETDFVIGLEGIGLTVSLSGTTFEDYDGDGVKGSGEPELAGRSVYLDLNSSATWDFDIDTFDATGGPVPIVDLTEVFWPMTVSGAPTDFSKLTVSLDIDHTYTSDLDIILIAPDGTEVLLASAVGGSGDNFTGTVFDDDATVPIASGNAPFTGSFIPQQPLGNLVGIDPNGEWTLSVEDFFNLDDGAITAWSLSFQTSEPIAQSDANGGYSFFNLANGDYTARPLPVAGWSDTGISSYDFTISGPDDANPGVDFGSAKNDRLYGFVFEDENANGNVDESETPLGGWTTFLDLNDNGLLDDPTTESETNSTPVNILDNQTVTSNINVTGRTGVVVDVDVRVNITHTWNSDLDVFLVGPDGTRVELFTDVGGSTDNFINTILDDDAETSITSGTAPFTGVFRPEGSLSALNQIDPNGDWTLEIGDDAGGDQGILNEWELILSTGEPQFTNDADGWMQVDLSPGSHSMVLILAEGWEHTSPIDGIHSVNADGSPLFNVRFGARQVIDSVIQTRGLFYNNATGSLLGSAGNAEGALDTSKTALLPGENSSFANYSSYVRGLNGLLVDISRLAPGATEEDVLSSLEFAVWDGIAAAGFVDLPAGAIPSVELVPSDDGSSTTRAKITFPDNSLRNTWLRTTVLANSTTRLTENDVFYFGNVVADFGVGNTASRIRVNAIDTAFVRANQSGAANSAAVTNPYDVNRDGRVNAIDTAIVRANQQSSGIVAPISAPSASNSSGDTKGGGFGKFGSSFSMLDDDDIEDADKKDLYFASLGSSVKKG